MVPDTSPLLYLHLIEQIELLPALFGMVHIPTVVHGELCHPGAPQRFAHGLNPRRAG
jgi:predicted nucleic acid-binding protein